MSPIPAISCALLLSSAGCAAAGTTNAVSWSTYDDFSGPGLDATLWTGGSGGALRTGAAGLTLSPTPRAGSVDQDIYATFSIPNGSFFAARVPFSTVGSAGDDGEIVFGIALTNARGTRQEAIWWGNADDYSLDGPIVTGNIFASDLTTGDRPLSYVMTTVTRGTLGINYSNGWITTSFNDGTGWQQLGTPMSTAGWGTLTFGLGAGTRVSRPASRYSANVPSVQIGQLGGVMAAVPEPAACVLLATGLALWGAGRFAGRFAQSPMR